MDEGPWLRLPTEEEYLAQVPAGWQFDYDIGGVPAMNRLILAHRDIAPAFSWLAHRLMKAPGALTIAERQVVAAVTAAAQDCHY